MHEFQPCRQKPSLLPSLLGENALGTFKSVLEGQGISTNTLTHAVSEHPLVSVTVTQYSVVAAGETFIEVVVSPVLHRYVPPPVAFNVVELPGLMVTFAPAFAMGPFVAPTTAVDV